MGDIQVVLWLSQWFRIVSFDSVAFNFCTPQKASVGMNSRCLGLTNLVCVLSDPAIPTSSFNFIVFLYLFLLFFIALSIIYQCHLNWLAHSTLSVIK